MAWGHKDKERQVAVPGHWDELRLKATALQALEGMNGQGGCPPGHHTWCLLAHLP